MALSSVLSSSSPLPLSRTELYLNYRASVAVNKININNLIWEYTDSGNNGNNNNNTSNNINNILICIPGTSGTCHTFYPQLVSLSSISSYRILSINYPPLWNIIEWTKDFNEFLNIIKY